jgi:hypothetical protein
MSGPATRAEETVKAWRWLALAAALWLVLVVIGLSARPLLPVDETRYVGVAWEMWQRGDFLVPFRNGEAYHHKPPLLFWLIQLGWAIGGVGETWGRLVAPIFAFACLPASAVLARRLFPDRETTSAIAPLLLIGSALFAVHASITMFDAMVTLWAIVGWIGIVGAARGGGRRSWILVALAIGLGTLSKGPVILLHLLPPALLAPLWVSRAMIASWRAWYGAVALSVLGGAALALAWAVPAAIAGGQEFARAIFLGQHAGRMTQAFSHARPLWWYAPVLLIGLSPMLWWLAPWRGLRGTPGFWTAPGLRFIVAVCVPVLAAFSLISGKQPHYVLPEFALLAILAARLVDRDGFRDHCIDRALPALISIGAGLVFAAFPLLVFPRLADGRADLALEVGHFAVIIAVAVVAILYGAALLAWGGWGAARRAASIAGVMAILVVGTHAAFLPLAPAYDAARPGEHLATIERAQRPIAWLGDYEGDFHFAGRLTNRIAELDREHAEAWIRGNPNGAVIATYRGRRDFPADAAPLYRGAYRGRVLVIWSAETLGPRAGDLLSDAPRR